MSRTIELTVLFEQGEDGWIVASVPEVPGALSQGRTREEAHENVLDALREILQLRLGRGGDAGAGGDREPLELVIGA